MCDLCACIAVETYCVLQEKLFLAKAAYCQSPDLALEEEAICMHMFTNYFSTDVEA